MQENEVGVDTKVDVTWAEIDRDERMIILGLLRALAAFSTEQITLAFACGRVEDPYALYEQIEAAVAKSREHYRRLNDARIVRRGTAPRHSPTTPPIPPSVQRFARNGVYAGSYARLGSLAKDVLTEAGALAPEIARYVDLDGAGLELHLGGDLWTMDGGGEVHAFRSRESAGVGESRGDEGTRGAGGGSHDGG